MKNCTKKNLVECLKHFGFNNLAKKVEKYPTDIFSLSNFIVWDGYEYGEQDFYMDGYGTEYRIKNADDGEIVIYWRSIEPDGQTDWIWVIPQYSPKERYPIIVNDIETVFDADEETLEGLDKD